MDNKDITADIPNRTLVTITKEAYEEFLENDMWLLALETAGVDNWQGYDHANDIFREMKSGN